VDSLKKVLLAARDTDQFVLCQLLVIACSTKVTSNADVLKRFCVDELLSHGQATDRALAWLSHLCCGEEPFISCTLEAMSSILQPLQEPIEENQAEADKDDSRVLQYLTTAQAMLRMLNPELESRPGMQQLDALLRDILEQYCTHPNPRVRSLAFSCVGLLCIATQRDDWAALFVQALEGDASDIVRGTAAQALFDLAALHDDASSGTFIFGENGEAAANRLSMLLREPSPEVRDVAIRGAAKLILTGQLCGSTSIVVLGLLMTMLLHDGIVEDSTRRFLSAFFFKFSGTANCHESLPHAMSFTLRFFLAQPNGAEEVKRLVSFVARCTTPQAHDCTFLSCWRFPTSHDTAIALLLVEAIARSRKSATPLLLSLAANRSILHLSSADSSVCSVVSHLIGKLEEDDDNSHGTAALIAKIKASLECAPSQLLPEEAALIDGFIDELIVKMSSLLPDVAAKAAIVPPSPSGDDAIVNSDDGEDDRARAPRHVVDEIQDDFDEQAPPPAKIARVASKPGIVVLFEDGIPDAAELAEIVRSLGAEAEVSSKTFHSRITHALVVTDSTGQRIGNGFVAAAALLTGRWVVTRSWVKESVRAGTFVDEAGVPGCCRLSFRPLDGKRIFVSSSFAADAGVGHLASPARQLLEKAGGVRFVERRCDADVALVGSTTGMVADNTSGLFTWDSLVDHLFTIAAKCTAALTLPSDCSHTKG
jgi:hypothetical protein